MRCPQSPAILQIGDRTLLDTRFYSCHKDEVAQLGDGVYAAICAAVRSVRSLSQDDPFHGDQICAVVFVLSMRANPASRL